MAPVSVITFCHVVGHFEYAFCAFLLLRTKKEIETQRVSRLEINQQTRQMLTFDVRNKTNVVSDVTSFGTSKINTL